MTMDGDVGLNTTPDADARRLAIEAIASLVYIKKTAADQVLRRAQVPEDLIRRFLTERDPATGDKRSKRDAGALVLDALAKIGQDHAVIRNIVAIAADWTAFHLAQNEYQARAVVRKRESCVECLRLQTNGSRPKPTHAGPPRPSNGAANRRT